MEKNMKKETCITESLCCTAEIKHNIVNKVFHFFRFHKTHSKHNSIVTFNPLAMFKATFKIMAAGKGSRLSLFRSSIKSFRDFSPPYSIARHRLPSLALVKAR